MWDERVVMNNDKSEHKKTGALRKAPHLAWAVSIFLLLVSFTPFAANAESLPVLRIGDHTYCDVTIRTKAKNYIFISHSSGMTSIKVTQLPNELREQLGYAPKTTPTPKRIANQAAALLEQVKAQILKTSRLIASKLQQPALPGLIATLLLAHLFCSYCLLLICQKIGMNPGMLVWFPVLQAVPMLRAASMSTWWLGAFLIPGLNVYAWVLWCIKVVAARQKTTPLAILLMFPPTSWFAFLFLALSEDARERGTKVRVEAAAFQTVADNAEAVGVRALLHSEQHIAA